MEETIYGEDEWIVQVPRLPCCLTAILLRKEADHTNFAQTNFCMMCKESIQTRYNQKTSPTEQWPHVEQSVSNYEVKDCGETMTKDVFSRWRKHH